jgi:hypothetical protein
MKTCCSIRTLCQGACDPMRNSRALTRASRVTATACVAALAAAWLAGCSDDVVCPEEVPPFVSARVTEIAEGREGSTFVEVFCSGDPLPDIFAVAINDRPLPEPAPSPDRPGFVTTLSETTIVWQAGTSCVLSVANDYGIAGAMETVPGAFVVAAPGTASAGATVALSWTDSDDADYYVLEATMAGAHAGTTALAEAIYGTSFDVDLSGFSGSGFLSGFVAAVSGPLPEAGAPGNVSGGGWGFMNISYRDSQSLFQVVISDAGGVVR